MFDPSAVTIWGNQVVQIIGILATLVTAITGLVVQLRRGARIEAKVDQVKEATNGTLSVKDARIDQLTTHLSDNDLPIPPPDPS